MQTVKLPISASSLLFWALEKLPKKLLTLRYNSYRGVILRTSPHSCKDHFLKSEGGIQSAVCEQKELYIHTAKCSPPGHRKNSSEALVDFSEQWKQQHKWLSWDERTCALAPYMAARTSNITERNCL